MQRNMNADLSSWQRRGENYINKAVASNVRMIRPDVWERGGKFVIRIWPLLDPEDPTGNLMPGRVSAYGSAGLIGMAMSEIVPCASYVGLTEDLAQKVGIRNASTQKYSSCSFIMSKARGESWQGVEYSQLPYVRMVATCNAAVKAADFGSPRKGKFDAKWSLLTPHPSRREAAIQKIKNVAFVVGSVYQNGDRLDLEREVQSDFKDGKKFDKIVKRNGVALGDATDDPLVVAMLSGSAAGKILKLCNVPNENYTGDVDVNPAKAFMYGDPTGVYDPETNTLRGGLFFTVYNPKKLSISKNSTQKLAPAEGERSHDDDEGNFGSYECAVSTLYTGPSGKISSTMNSEQVNNVFDKQLYLWPDTSDPDPNDNSYLLRIPSIEEQCVLLTRAFRLLPDLLRFCWADTPEYLAFSEVSSIMNARTSTLVPEGKKRRDDDYDDDDDDDDDDRYDDDDDDDDDDDRRRSSSRKDRRSEVSRDRSRSRDSRGSVRDEQPRRTEKVKAAPRPTKEVPIEDEDQFVPDVDADDEDGFAVEGEAVVSSQTELEEDVDGDEFADFDDGIDDEADSDDGDEVVAESDDDDEYEMFGDEEDDFAFDVDGESDEEEDEPPKRSDSEKKAIERAKRRKQD
jgi:hypothetical protein